jgi:NAD(P)-dependent dehydrogenase (short-subunit alcohol dehydrogenase family)
MTDRFANTTVVITGAASGIGLATARLLLEEGARVVATDVHEEALAQVAAGRGSQLVAVAGDITQPSTIDRVVAATDGVVDGLANVAGIMDGFLPPSEVDDATWERVLDVNLTAPMRLTRAVLPIMMASGGGAIVNVASEAALRGSAAGAAYTASKHAVVGYTKNVAFMHGPQGIRANAVLPGPVATNIEGASRSELAAQRVFPLMGAIGLRPVDPVRIAAAIAWLLSPDSENVNGAVLPSDGGWSAI